MLSDLFCADVERWRSANVNKIRAIEGNGLGWEVWAQTEIWYHFRDLALSHRIGFVRERRVYGGQQRVDFLLHAESNIPRHDVFVGDVLAVELKCGTQASSANVTADVRKLLDGYALATASRNRELIVMEIHPHLVNTTVMGR